MELRCQLPGRPLGGCRNAKSISGASGFSAKSNREGSERWMRTLLSTPRFCCGAGVLQLYVRMITRCCCGAGGCEDWRQTAADDHAVPGLRWTVGSSPNMSLLRCTMSSLCQELFWMALPVDPTHGDCHEKGAAGVWTVSVSPNTLCGFCFWVCGLTLL